jgi:hypothetical protein
MMAGRYGAHDDGGIHSNDDDQMKHDDMNG